MKIRSFVALTICPLLLAAAELPVRTVALYKHGVGFFQREGQLASGESARLDFKADEMNDVLKSLTVNDQGGKVTGLRYDSSIPLSQKLTEFPFDINAGAPLSAVIDQFKGARIEMDFGTQKTAGAIVSSRLIPGDKDRSEHEQLTLLLDSGEIRNVDLGVATAIRFTDPKLQLQFKDYLAALTGARSRDKRSVYIDSTDSKARDVRAEYIIPMPAWKSSYRLLFDDKSTEPTLEGWAIVDNTTGEDWTNIHLSLVSGKPISFISQLYAPKFISRVGAELAEDNPVAPTVYSGAVQSKAAAPPPPPAAAAARRNGVIGGVAGGAVNGFLAGPEVAESLRAQTSTIAETADGQEIADLFQYTIANPVTVRKDESAMLPFLQQKITGRKLIIYSDQTRPNPFNAAELTNTTGKTLDGGPITVFDGGAYAGEALIETVKNSDKRFINYGVDLGTRISTVLSAPNNTVREFHAHNGLIISKTSDIQKKTYTIANVDPRAKTLIVEHPLRRGYNLIDTPKPVETTQNLYRFEVKVPASGSAELPVTEERIYDTQVSVSSMTPDLLLTYIRNKALTDAARRQLQQISDTKTALANSDIEKKSVNEQVDSLTRDEQRNRDNIASLSNVSGQQQIVQDYARKLSDQETQIAKLRDRATALDQQKATLQTQMNSQIAKLDF
ncbi:MAG TPA: DUF4139 domain-containing protein [Bryobacteraceae bacterium]|nr:DUF4139 domain-containing protein [Bryobacteraceae bacterium]